MSTEIISLLVTAGTGLLGVLIGAAAAVAGPVILRRRDVAQEIERAKRTVGAELYLNHNVYLALSATSASGTDGTRFPVEALSTRAWNSSSALLAQSLEPSLWARLVGAYGLVSMDIAASTISEETDRQGGTEYRLTGQISTAGTVATLLRNVGLDIDPTDYYVGLPSIKLDQAWPDPLGERTQ